MEASVANPVLAKQFDMVELNRRGEYEKYFSVMTKLFGLLMKCYELQFNGGNLEAKTVESFVGKLLRSMEALKMKYYFNKDRSLKVDLEDSGFPNYLEIDALNVDLTMKADSLCQLPAEAVLKRAILDQMLEQAKEPIGELMLLSTRSYFEMLNENDFFLTFTPGELTLTKTTPEYRSYTFAWAYWDFATNCPYINLMTFHQDASHDPLETKGFSFNEFMQVIKSEGTRSCDVGILAMTIDEQIESIHPKIIKRICLGPVYLKFLVNSDNIDGEEYCNPSLAQAMTDCNLSDDDLVLIIEDDIVFSNRQTIHKSMLGLKSKVREIFYIPEDDPECYERRASVVHRYALMPHNLFQHLKETGKVEESGFSECKIITYDDKEEIYGV